MTTLQQTTDIPSLFQAELTGLEKILWTGRAWPQNSWGMSLFLVPFGLVVLGFSIVFILGTSGLLSPGHKLSPFAFFGLAAIPGLRAGYYFALHPFISRYWLLPNTYYALTDQRVLRLCTVPTKSLEELPLTEIKDLRKIIDENGMGSIAFTNKSSQGDDDEPVKDVFLTFDNIPDAGSVYKLIQERAHNAKDPDDTQGDS